jgi:hypothetical protein
MVELAACPSSSSALTMHRDELGFDSEGATILTLSLLPHACV